MNAASDVFASPDLHDRCQVKCNFLLHQIAMVVSSLEDACVVEEA